MIGKHKLSIIVAVDDNWAIGKDNDLLYKIPTDMKFFKEKTKDNIVLYGYNTLLSFPNQKALPNRTNIVLCPNNLSAQPDLFVAHSIDEASEFIKNLDDDREVFICGGASIYKQYVDICDSAYVTKIQAKTPEATAFMVNLDQKNNWQLTQNGNPIIDTFSGLPITFNIYQRNN